MFHRNIRGFIVQGGDPTGTGKGGAAYHGGRLEDEIVDALKHNARGIVSMANKGPNTAGSQVHPAPSHRHPHTGSAVPTSSLTACLVGLLCVWV